MHSVIQFLPRYTIAKQRRFCPFDRHQTITPSENADNSEDFSVPFFHRLTDSDNFYTPTPSKFWNYTPTRVMTPKKGVQLSSFTKANFHFARRGQLEDLKYRTAIILSARAPPRTLLAELTALFQTIAGGEEARCPLFKNPTSDLGPSGL